MFECSKCRHSVKGYDEAPCCHCINNKAMSNFYEEETEKFRPYKNTKEMIDDFIMRFNTRNPPKTNPLIWVRSNGVEYLITGYGKEYVIIGDKKIAVDSLVSCFEYLDGTSVGVKV